MPVVTVIVKFLAICRGHSSETDFRCLVKMSMDLRTTRGAQISKQFLISGWHTTTLKYWVLRLRSALSKLLEESESSVCGVAIMFLVGN